MQLLVTAATVGTMMMATAAAATTIMIDDFTVPRAVDRSGANTASGRSVEGADIFGGRRKQGVENNVHGGSWLEISTDRAEPGDLFFTTNRDGRMRLSYGGGAFALGDVAGLGVNSFEVGVKAITTSTAFDFSVVVCDDQEQDSCFESAIEGVTATTPVSSGPPFTLTIPFASFAAEADFGDVHWLHLYARPDDPGFTDYSELVLSEFQFTTVSASGVPLPAGWALMAIGGAALALSSRRRLSA